MRSGFAEANGTRLYYEVAGSGDPMVLIQSNGGDCRLWDDQFDVFAGGFTVVRYDHRGFGKSSLPIQGEGYSHYGDLKALLEYLGLPRAHILGLCSGAAHAINFAIANPKMSRTVVLASPWIDGYSSPAIERVWSILDLEKIPQILKESGTRAATEHWWKTLLSDELAPTPVEVTNRYVEMGYDYSYWHFVNEDPERGLNPPAVQRLDTITAPILIITSDHDLEACKEMADLLEQAVPNSRKVIISDAGHIVNMEAPDRFNEAVLGFLADNS